MKAVFFQHTLQFKRPGGTSRGVLHTKDTWYLRIEKGEKWGIGECGMFRGLSADDRPDFEEKLQWVCDHIQLGETTLLQELQEFPAIQIGVEAAFRSLASEDPFTIFPSEFTKGTTGMDINGLIWMGSQEWMHQQIEAKLKEGFSCIKMKIGAIDFESELALLQSIRDRFTSEEIELRVDANGAFSPSEALEKLERLAVFDLHSIEQPIAAGQWQEMAALCEKTPLPIALDEELIGIFSEEKRNELLTTVQPQYIILKPTLVGGFANSDLWISRATAVGAGWWITSALESNVGLNAISQYTFTKNSKLPQGLGTGSLFTNNIEAPLTVQNGQLQYSPKRAWDAHFLRTGGSS
ncbi:o-succinylbenzoate synthase [Altibacter sp. HG106]|uniref:o-succinylbenzoate synthase n=1 Tax=Altibacter sp. HG106 TaxID=3023937 RepID=UPI0023503628|nr:o-succinylbenzoate synthase [Altibacter sp. HG106]MDC7993923.1 o-succinylbenzoate synthase [Altibacter sp. HG106]